MSNYRRLYIEGGCYFFTVVTHQRQHILNLDENILLLKTAFKKTKNKFPFEIQAIVILPDHLHCIWELPEGDFDFSTLWRLIKNFFTKEMHLKGNAEFAKKIWQRRYWEHLIRNERDWLTHVNYMFLNLGIGHIVHLENLLSRTIMKKIGERAYRMKLLIWIWNKISWWITPKTANPPYINGLELSFQCR